MRLPTRSRTITALFTTLACALALNVAGCGGEKLTRAQTIQRYSQELRDVVSHHVTEETRKQQLLLIVDEVDALQIRFSNETREFVADYRKLNADYDAPRSAFEQLFAGFEAQQVQARSAALDLHFRMAALAHADEWDAIWKAEKKLYEATSATSTGNEGVT